MKKRVALQTRFLFMTQNINFAKQPDLIFDDFRLKNMKKSGGISKGDYIWLMKNLRGVSMEPPYNFE